MGYETVSVDPGSNPSVPVAVDQVAGQDIQIVKLDVGADGVSTPFGSLSNGLPVDLKTLSPGAATSSNQTTANTSLSSIDTKLTSSATAAKQDTGNTSLASIDGKVNLSLSALRDALLGVGNKTLSDVVTALGSLTVTVSSEVEIKNDAGNPVPVSASSLPLPTGAATAANQGTANTSLSSIDTKTATPKTADFDTGAGTDTVQMAGIALPKSGGAVAGGTSSDPLRTDPTGTTTQPISASALPLPAGASTAANQSAGNSSLSNIDNSTSAPTTVLNGKKTVTTAGTRVTLASSTAAKSVTIKALAANTGTIYVGDSSVSSTNGFTLQAGETVSLDISNLGTVNLDASVNGEGVTYIGVA